MRTYICRPAVILALLTLAAPLAHAQTVDEIVAKNIEAKGGYERLKNTNSVRIKGTGTMQGSKVGITTVTKRPYFVRNEMSLAGQRMIVGFDGQTAWMSVAGAPAQAMPEGPQTEGLKQSSHIDSPLFDYKARGTRITLGEPLKEAGRTLHHLIVTPKDGPPMHYYIDPQTGLEDRLVIEVEDGGQPMKMEMKFSNFKAVDGRSVPHTIQQFVNGKLLSELTYESVEFNVPVDDAIFRMPKQPKG